MAKMNRGIAVLFCLCVFISYINQAAYADKEDTSEEIIEDEYQHSSLETNNTTGELSLESHEAMTKGVEFKPKFTTATSSTTNREKRSYEFLMGLVNNNSKFQVTNSEDDIRIPMRRDKVLSEDIGASEVLLEMMVKIAAHPDQWEQVHNLLQKIDNDLTTSKKIISEMETSLAQNNSQKSRTDVTNTIEVNKKVQDKTRPNQRTVNQSNFDRQYKMNNNTNIQQATISADDGMNHRMRNNTQDAMKMNQWSYGIVNKEPMHSTDDRDALTTKYPWQPLTKPAKNTLPRNFAYHRVTGNPLYHTNPNNNPKAYIAVSVIAPKPINDRPTEDDLVLENELRQLKPWTHNQNLKNMASIRSRWVIQSDKEKASYAP